jgi:hypothetical protein
MKPTVRRMVLIALASVLSKPEAPAALASGRMAPTPIGYAQGTT